jgi:hypothetical protein
MSPFQFPPLSSATQYQPCVLYPASFLTLSWPHKSSVSSKCSLFIYSTPLSQHVRDIQERFHCSNPHDCSHKYALLWTDIVCNVNRGGGDVWRVLLVCANLLPNRKHPFNLSTLALGHWPGGWTCFLRTFPSLQQQLSIETKYREF